VAVAAALLLALAAAAPPADAVPARGDPAARLPSGALAGEYWDVVARFDSGHVLIVEVTLANTVLGGRLAVAVGQLSEPDGTAHRFSRSESDGQLQLGEEGRRIDLRSIVLDQSAARRRLVVDKNEFGLDVAIDPMGAPAWPTDEAMPGCPFDVLEVAGQATGRLRLPGRAPLELHGLAAVTHRWMPDLEVACQRRSVELFAMDGDLGLYLRQTLDPEGRERAWLLLQRGGRTLHQGPPAESELRWRQEGSEYPELAGLRVAYPGFRAQAEVGAPLGTFEPLSRLPAPLRLALELRTRPRLVWSAPRCEVVLGEGEDRLRWNAPALVKLTYTNPLSIPPPSPSSAAGGE